MWISRKKFDELEAYNDRLFNKNLELRSDLYSAEEKIKSLSEPAVMPKSILEITKEVQSSIKPKEPKSKSKKK